MDECHALVGTNRELYRGACLPDASGQDRNLKVPLPVAG
jgi:hypothetical protein